MYFYYFKAKYYNDMKEEDVIVAGIVAADNFTMATNRIEGIYGDRNMIAILELRNLENVQNHILFEDEIMEVIENGI